MKTSHLQDIISIGKESVSFLITIVSFLILINSKPFKVILKLFKDTILPYVKRVVKFLNKHKIKINFTLETIGLLGFGACSVMSTLIYITTGNIPAVIFCIGLGLYLKLMYSAMKIKEDIIIRY